MLRTYNLSHDAYFAIRTQNDSSTAIYDIFVDNIRLRSSSTCPITNGFSHHDARFLITSNIVAETTIQSVKNFLYSRKQNIYIFIKELKKIGNDVL
jgi:hypothetical protein